MAMERMFVTKTRGRCQDIMELLYSYRLEGTDVFFEEDGWVYFGAIGTATNYEWWCHHILDFGHMIKPEDIEFDVFYAHNPLND